MTASNPLFKIISPVNGDVLYDSDGVHTNTGFITSVKVAAPENLDIFVNGIRAEYVNGTYTSKVELKGYSSIITVEEHKSGESERINVLFLKNYQKHYRISIDDCIWVFRDLSQNSLVYKSMFDNSFLGMLKELNESYGTKIHLNVFYNTDGFNLSQMTCKYKEEWKANSDWLKLSFHAYAEFPDKPYKYADYEKVSYDCRLVMNEIRRFAGDEVMEPVTTIHWGEANREGCRALRDLGYKCLAGYFKMENDEPLVSYYFDQEQIEHMCSRYIWIDNSEDIIFSKCAIVIDKNKLDSIADVLNQTGNPPYVDYLVHEQYFHKDYINYQPDYRDKLIAAVKWAQSNGYTPAHLCECVYE